MSSKFLLLSFITAATFCGVANAQSDQGMNNAPVVHSKKEVRAQNRALEKKVRHALTASKQLNSSDIRIIAKNGKVALEGDVPDPTQIQLAGDVATKVSGVSSVQNNLTVREEGN